MSDHEEKGHEPVGWRGDYPRPKYPTEAQDVSVGSRHAQVMRQIQHAFTYHWPVDDQPPRYVALREAGKAMAEMIVAYTPVSREQSVALTKLEEVIMWANAAIARNEK